MPRINLPHLPTVVPLIWVLVCLLPPAASILAQDDGKSDKSPGLMPSSGGFASVWNRQFFIGPGVIELEKPSADSASLPHRPARLPGDFEPHQAVVLPGGKLAERYPHVLAAILENLGEGSRPVLLVSSPEQRTRLEALLRGRKLSPAGMRILDAATDTVWLRDYGPVFVYEPDGTLAAIDPAYGKPRERDDSVPKIVAAEFNIPIVTTPLLWQGGNLLSNGRGLLLTTTQAINANIESGRDAKTAFAFLRDRLGVRKVVVLEHLRGEKTGHVDMFACFTGPDTVVVGKYDTATDPINAALLDRNAARLAAVRIGERPLNVIRVPMPTNDDGICRTYTNVLFAGDAVLVPIYPAVEKDIQDKALAVFRALLPDRKIVGINAEPLAADEGGPRCICDYVPVETRRKQCPEGAQLVSPGQRPGLPDGQYRKALQGRHNLEPKDTRDKNRKTQGENP